jgi:anthranilate synthase
VTLSVLGEPWHGKPGLVRVPGRIELLAGLPPEFTAARYHSLYAPVAEVGGGFAVTAATGEVAMAIENAQAGRWAVQFHPESILTATGRTGHLVIANVLRLTRTRSAASAALRA